ncbi:MAG: ribonuclease R [Flammeovirgaceae bacterium]
MAHHKHKKKTKERKSLSKFLEKTSKNTSKKSVTDGKINPDTVQKVLELFDNNPQKFYTFKHLCKEFGITAKKYKLELEGILIALISQNFIEEVDDEVFRSTKETEGIIGIVDYVNPSFAYIIPENKKEGDEDIWVNTKNLMRALDGDKVEVQLIHTNKNKPEGKVVRIIERGKREFVGTVDIDTRYAFVIPTDRKMHFDIFVHPADLNGAEDGQRVVVEIIEWKDRDKNPIGRIKKVLGYMGEHETEMHTIMFEFGLPDKFPEDVEHEAEKISTKILKKDLKNRRDFRGVTTFTIDPVNAKDFDDALSIRALENNQWEIGVHIADVSYYVKPDSLLEKEAYQRATSVYLVDRVVPMLPEKLSNVVCSLRPNEDRLTFSVVFVLDDEANILSQWFGRTVIHSNRRFTYEEAQTVLETGKGDYAEELIVLNNLAKKLRKERFKNGAISFESPEFYFELDELGRPIRLTPKIRKDAHKLIEEFMLLANKAVATFVYNKKEQGKPVTMVYRIHDDPDPQRIEDLAHFVHRFGYKLNTKPFALRQSLNQLSQDVEGKQEQGIIEAQALRSMAKARYTTDAKPHYGLGFDHYSHFTSPIRRYPDVMAHRLLQHYLDGGKSVNKEEFEERCKHSSAMEKRAADAERASIKYKQVEYMERFLKKVMSGYISGVTEWGIYVEMDETKCEGLVRYSEMKDDHYIYDEKNFQVVGQKTKKVYRLGDRVHVRVMKTDLEKRTIELNLLKS